MVPDPHEVSVNTIHQLHHVILECHGFLVDYNDPSVLFTPQFIHDECHSPVNLTPPEERLLRDWGIERRSCNDAK